MHTYSTHILQVHPLCSKHVSVSSSTACRNAGPCLPPAAQPADGCNADVELASSAAQPADWVQSRNSGLLQTMLHNLVQINALQRCKLFGSPSQTTRKKNLLQIRRRLQRRNVIKSLAQTTSKRNLTVLHSLLQIRLLLQRRNVIRCPNSDAQPSASTRTPRADKIFCTDGE